MQNHSFLYAMIVALALPVCLSVAPAQAAEPQIVQCSFGDGQKATDTTLVLPDQPAVRSSQSVYLGVLPGPLPEQRAKADLVPASKSPIRKKTVDVGFFVDESLGYIIRLAENGDGVAYPVDATSGQPDVQNPFFGTCANTRALFSLWR
jgi:hypothetical protein